MKLQKNFITFEGGEGAGKSTQINNLADFLKGKGFDVIITREPGGTPIAEMLRDIIVKNHHEDLSPSAELGILASARLIHLETLILPALKQGKIVLCDRYIDSTYVYQGVCQGLGVDYINAVHEKLLGDKFILPQTTYYIDVDVDVGLARSQGGEKNEDRFENKDILFHHDIQNGFKELSKNNDRFFVIDGNNDMKNVKEQILTHSESLF